MSKFIRSNFMKFTLIRNKTVLKNKFVISDYTNFIRIDRYIKNAVHQLLCFNKIHKFSFKFNHDC